MDASTLAEEIRQSAEDFITTLFKFSDEQLNTVPFAASWTAGQVADHIIKATDGIPDTQTMAPDRSPDLYVETLRSLFLDFTVKFESPEFIAPEAGPFRTRDQVLQLLRIKNQNAAIAITRDLKQVCLDFELPGLGHLTRYEWLNFISVHTQRHTYQLKCIAEKILSVSV